MSKNKKYCDVKSSSDSDYSDSKKSNTCYESESESGNDTNSDSDSSSDNLSRYNSCSCSKCDKKNKHHKHNKHHKNVNKKNKELAYVDYYALMMSDNPMPISPGSAIEFPHDGPTNGIIKRLSTSQFLLQNVGTYLINWQICTLQPAQLVLALNNGCGVVELLNTVVGTTSTESQIVGSRIINTSVQNTILSVLNPSNSVNPITLSVMTGGTNPVSASINIIQLC
jgi:hypothetical protein